MLSEKIQPALNEQLNAELYSSYLYLSMSSYFKSVNLEGFSNWMHVQAQEELVHAMKFYDFVLQRGGKVVLKEVKAPPTDWASPLNVFENALEHEQKVTGLINQLVGLALAENDHATHIFLQWFVTEQIEEEENADYVVRQLKFMDGAKGGLFMMDRELAKRVLGPQTDSPE